MFEVFLFHLKAEMQQLEKLRASVSQNNSNNSNQEDDDLWWFAAWIVFW